MLRSPCPVIRSFCIEEETQTPRDFHAIPLSKMFPSCICCNCTKPDPQRPPGHSLSTSSNHAPELLLRHALRPSPSQNLSATSLCAPISGISFNPTAPI